MLGPRHLARNGNVVPQIYSFKSTDSLGIPVRQIRESDFHQAVLPKNSVKGKQNLNFGEITQGEKGRESVTTPIATLGRAESDNSKGFSFWKCEGISVSEWTGRQQPGLVSDYFLYKQLLWVRNGSLPLPCSDHRMEICRCGRGYLISLLLFLFHSETACLPLQKRPCRMQAFR